MTRIVDQEHWQRVNELFEAAADMSADQQAAFLDEHCLGNDKLREEVRSLLDADSQRPVIVDEPCFELVAKVLLRDSPQLSEGQYVGRYKVLGILGSGGMGEVYLAHDASLGRKVALKMLPLDFATDQERVRRLQQEAGATSALNHPNIITIYEIGEFEGRHFIATEFIDGKTLRELVRERRLELNETIGIAAQIASALEAAHRVGGAVPTSLLAAVAVAHRPR